LSDAANVVYGFKIEVAMLGVDEGPVKTGGGKKTRNFRRPQRAEVQPELQFSSLEGEFNLVDAHQNTL
jgi:hypothetical protein